MLVIVYLRNCIPHHSFNLNKNTKLLGGQIPQNIGGCLFTLFPSLAYVRQFLIRLQKLKHWILRVFCKINYFWKYKSDKRNIVSVINKWFYRECRARERSCPPQLFWVFWNRDIFLETVCIESKTSFLC